MGFEKRLTELRKKYKLSQGDLAQKVGVHINVLGRYERGLAKPSIEIAAKLANILDVSLDYLVGKEDMEIDPKVMNKVLTIQQLPEKDKEHILFTLDALLRDAKARLAYNS